MGEIIYGKLVRDTIPQIISNDNQKPVTRVLGDEEYRQKLLEKRGGFAQKIFLEKAITND